MNHVEDSEPQALSFQLQYTMGKRVLPALKCQYSHFQWYIFLLTQNLLKAYVFDHTY